MTPETEPLARKAEDALSFLMHHFTVRPCCWSPYNPPRPRNMITFCSGGAIDPLVRTGIAEDASEVIKILHYLKDSAYIRIAGDTPVAYAIIERDDMA